MYSTCICIYTLIFMLYIPRTVCTYYQSPSYYILGSIKLLKDEMKHWELQVDHSFFALYKLDITVSTLLN